MTLRVAKSRGFDISYEDVGDGPTVVLVSGFAWPASSWRELGYVDRLVASGYRVLSVDLLGHGSSERSYDWEAYLAPDIARDVISAIDDAGVSQAAVWRYSRGAGLVTMAAVEFPSRVSSLVVGGLSWVGSSATDEISPWTRALERGDWNGFWEELGAPVPEIDRRYMEESSDPLAMAAVDIGRQRSRHVVDPARVRASTFLYYGAEDAGATADAAAAGFGVDLHILDGQHDHSQAIRDVDAIVPIVLGFLESNPTT